MRLAALGQPVLEGAQRQRIDHVGGREPAFAGHADAEPEHLELLQHVRVGVDREAAAGGLGLAQEASIRPPNPLGRGARLGRNPGGLVSGGSRILVD